MIKVINIYKDTRVLEMTDGSNIGLGVETDNKVDLLRFTFDDLLVGSATLLTDLKDSQGNLVAFPLTLNEDLNSYDLTITQAIVSKPTLTFQVEIAYDGDKIWHSKQATLQVDKCLEIGTGEMPTTISNWLENANLVLDEMEQATRETENLNIEVGTETSTSIPVTFTDKEGNQTTVNIKGAKGERGERGEQGIQGVPGQNGADGHDATINGVNTLTIEEGQNITIEQVGNVMTISSSGGGGGSTNYNDLSNKPSINNVTLSGNKSLNDLGIQPSGNYVTPSDLSSVATSGSYNDLTNKPTIPSKTSDLTNDSGFITNSALTNYVTNTDYATSTTGGVIKVYSYNARLNSSGILYADARTYEQYSQGSDNQFISKGTLENVITGKDLTTKAYVDSLVGDINTALDTINGEVI